MNNVKNAFMQIKAARVRKVEAEKRVVADQEEDAADEAVLRGARERLRGVVAERTAVALVVSKLEFDIAAAESKIKQLNADIALWQIDLQEHQRRLLPLEKEVSELREALA